MDKDQKKVFDEMKHTVFMNVSYGVLGMGHWGRNEWLIDEILEILVQNNYRKIEEKRLEEK